MRIIGFVLVKLSVSSVGCREGGSGFLWGLSGTDSESVVYRCFRRFVGLCWEFAGGGREY